MPNHLTRLAPGAYADEYGGLFIDVPELLKHHGYADTPENRQMMADVGAEMAREIGASVRVVEQPALFDVEEMAPANGDKGPSPWD